MKRDSPFFMTDTRASYPRFFFLHLLAIITLYVSVVSTIVLFFQYINLLLPDPLYFYPSGILDTIRWSAAIDIIMFPVFVVSTWLVNREIAMHPEEAEYRIRKWLLTFTIFLAALVIIGDLITLLYNFLSGDLTASFILKILVVLAIAAAVFGYELLQLKRKDFKRSNREKMIAWGASAAMAASIIVGLFLAGSPMQQRRVRFDERRVGDLQMLQNEVINNWSLKNTLPKTIDELGSPLTGFTVPRDPKTGEPYGYRVLSPLKFELCADFETDTDAANIPSAKPLPRAVYPTDYYGAEHWNHTAGRVCFERTIDPALYPDRPGKPM